MKSSKNQFFYPSIITQLIQVENVSGHLINLVEPINQLICRNQFHTISPYSLFQIHSKRVMNHIVGKKSDHLTKKNTSVIFSEEHR